MWTHSQPTPIDQLTKWAVDAVPEQEIQRWLIRLNTQAIHWAPVKDYWCDYFKPSTSYTAISQTVSLKFPDIFFLEVSASV